MMAHSRTKSLKLKHVVYVPFGASVLDSEKFVLGGLKGSNVD
jgi:hypothetical protein